MRSAGATLAYLPAFSTAGARSRAVLVTRRLVDADIMWLLDTAYGFRRPYMSPTALPAGVRCSSCELAAVDDAAMVYTTWDEEALPTDPPVLGGSWRTVRMHVTGASVFWRVTAHTGTHTGVYETEELSIRQKLAIGPAFRIVKAHMRTSHG